MLRVALLAAVLFAVVVPLVAVLAHRRWPRGYRRYRRDRRDR